MARGDHDPRFWKILELYDYVESLESSKKDYLARMKEQKAAALDQIIEIREQLEGGPKVGKNADLFTIHQGDRLIGHGRNK